MIGPVLAYECSVTDVCEAAVDCIEAEGRPRFEVILTATYPELVRVEEGYLRAAGWTKEGDDAWTHPDFERRGGAKIYQHGHAVNAQKLIDRSGRKTF